MKIVITEDCDNAPKKRFVRDLNIAYAKGDIHSVLERVTEDVRWEFVGSGIIEGSEDLAAELVASRSTVKELVIDNILSHGNRCAANGTIRYSDGAAVTFCDIYVFDSHGKSAKIKEVVSYALRA